MSFDSPEQVKAALEGAGYLSTDEIATTVHLAQQLRKPVLIEGPAGVGKTELAKAVAHSTACELIRLQCYEGIDESKALYEWDYRKQLLHIQATNDEADIFSERFLVERPLLQAIRTKNRSVLLIDEIDRVEVETEALLLEVLAEFQVTIPELGTLRANSHPMVFLTSNNSRDLSEALKRRCLFLPMEFPSVQRERAIIAARVPAISSTLAGQVADTVSRLRQMDLRKVPSISESIDWARALVGADVSEVTDEYVLSTLGVLVKNRADMAKVQASLRND